MWARDQSVCEFGRFFWQVLPLFKSVKAGSVERRNPKYIFTLQLFSLHAL